VYRARGRPVSPRAIALAVGVLSILVFVQLGSYVSSLPPLPLDAAAIEERGRFAPLALAFTQSGRFEPYAILCAVGLAFGLVRRRWLAAALVQIALMLAVWRVSDLFKALFHRARPDWWYGIHETSFSYPSGHAALSIAFYGFATYAIVRAGVPSWLKAGVAIVAGVMIVGIGWSRLALGAHFPTDLIGGYLLGIAGLCCAVVVHERVSRAATAMRGRAVPAAASPVAGGDATKVNR